MILNETIKRIIQVGGLACLMFLQMPALLSGQSVLLPEPEVINDRQGLPQAFVPAITQDQRGFIWMATLDGLCRYDGHHFNVLQPSSSGRPSLSSVGVLHVKRNEQGLLWVAGERSLDLFNPLHETFVNISRQAFYKPFSDYRLTAIYPGQRNSVWLVFMKQGIARLDLTTQQIHHYPINPNVASALTNDKIRSIVEDRQGFLWIATSEGLDRLTPKTHQITSYRRQSTKLALPEWNLHGVHQRSNGTLLVISRNYLTVLQPKTGQTRAFPLPKPVSDADAVRFAIDSQGNDYISFGNQLLRFKDQDGLQPIIYSSETWQIKSLFIDQSDVLWLGTDGSGIRQFNLRATRFKVHPYIQNFHTDLLVHHLGVPAKQLPVFPVDASVYNFRYTLDRNQKLWFNVGNTPFYQLNLQSRQLTTIPVPASWQKNDAHYPISLTTDPDGKVWAVCDSVAMWYDESNRSWQSFPFRVKPNLAQLNGKKTTVFQAVVDKQALWISTGSQGLFRIDRSSGRVRQFVHQPNDSTSLSHNTLFCLSSDPSDQDILWIGTFGGGLCRFDKRTGKCQRITKLHGLPNNVVYTAIPDQQGNLWIATNKGLCRMNRRNAINGTVTFRTYNRKDGLLADEFNRFHFLHLPGRGAADDRVILGGLEGITAFEPEALSDDRFQPSVELTTIEINNRQASPALIDSLPVQAVQELQLPHNQNYLTVGFAALQFNNTSRLQYRYQLKGLDNDWIYTFRPEAIYTNLSPGTYTLRLNASNTSGIWSSHIRNVTITIHPPWWATWWAYALYVVTLGGIILALVRAYWRRKEAEQLKELDAMKTRFFSNITHEFRTPLTLILAPTQQLKQKLHEPDDVRRLAAIDRNAHQLLELVNQLMDLSKLEAKALSSEETLGDLVQFVDEVVQSFGPQAEAKGIRLRFTTSDMASQYAFDARNLERIIYNLVSNALKFTQDGGEVLVHLAPSVTLTVSDSGVGIPAEKLPHIFDRFYQADDSSTRQQEGTGIGLALVKELVDLQKGSISVESTVGQGTTFTVKLPYQPAQAVLPVTNEQPLSAADSTETFTYERSGESPVILLVEDNSELATVIAESLPTSYQIYRTSNGAEGVEQAIQLVPDLIISDVLMPIMDGYTLCQQLKADQRTNHIPILLLTAKSSHESRITGLTVGADDYITKPFHPQELQLRVRNRLEQRRQLRDWIRSSLTRVDVAETNQTPETDDPFLTNLYTLIEQNLDDSRFGADGLMEEIRMSRMSLHRKVKALTGMSSGELIRTYRLKRSIQFLLEGYNSSETAYRVGFDSPAYFSKCFRDTYQLTPTEFATSFRR
ncbi:response regulator [Spirosoma sp. BT702]|uniref:histidine kinase n=1 Tax=Spirosoma profusum TaxID=2771354 RepID=A0A926XVT2_9BACT|nr:ATP-binding protein [Spirosoma profusum]MBD2701452.1 response regulator [Spirosoma profusum]